MKAFVAVGIVGMLVACKGKESSSKPAEQRAVAARGIKVEKLASCEGRLRIQAAYPGAFPDEVEQAVVRPLEEAIQHVAGVRTVHAYALAGQAEVVAEIDASHRDSALAAAKDALHRITSFPDGVEPPVVFADQGDSRFVLFVAHGAVGEVLLSSWVRTLRDRLLQSPSVYSVSTVGQAGREIRVEVERAKLDAYGSSPESLATAIRTSWLDATGPAHGSDLATIQVPLGDRGKTIRLADVATISEGVSERGSARLGAEPAVLVATFGKPDAEPGALLEEAGTIAREHARPDIAIDVLGTVTVANCGGPGVQLRGPVLIAEVQVPAADEDAQEQVAKRAVQLVSKGANAVKTVVVHGDGLVALHAPAVGASAAFELIGLAGSEKRAGELADLWRERLSALPDAQLAVFAPGDSRVTVEVALDDYAALERATDDLLERLSGEANVRAVETSAKIGRPEVRIRVSSAASEFGLTAAEVTRQLRWATGSTEVGTVRVGRDQTPVVLRMTPELRPEELQTISLMVPGGKRVQLGNVVSIERGEGPAFIYHRNGKRTVTVSVVPVPGQSSVKLAQHIQSEVLPELREAHPGLEATVR